MWYDRNVSNPFFTPINPTPEIHINEESDDENEASNDDDEDSNDVNEKVVEFKLSEKDTLEQITIESEDKDSYEEEIID